MFILQDIKDSEDWNPEADEEDVKENDEMVGSCLCIICTLTLCFQTVFLLVYQRFFWPKYSS
jgi:hypothetical protein